jgi:hypothetical protein
MMQVMLDLETMSTQYNATIASIGAVKFTVEDGVVDTFYQTVDVQSCKDVGLHVSKDTVRWWMKQSKAAREALLKDTIPLLDALTKFSKWFGSKSLPVWGNGATFDNVIITSAYEAVDLARPWKYFDDRCYRTIRSLIQIPDEERKGVYHNALDDAVYQTNHLLNILKS